MLQSRTRTVLEVPGSLRAHPNGIGHQPRTTVTILTTGGSLSCHLDHQHSPAHLGSKTGEAGTLDHHPTVPPTRPLANPIYHSATLCLSLRRRPQQHPQLAHGPSQPTKLSLIWLVDQLQLLGKSSPLCVHQPYTFTHSELTSKSLFWFLPPRHAK